MATNRVDVVVSNDLADVTADLERLFPGARRELSEDFMSLACVEDGMVSIEAERLNGKPILVAYPTARLLALHAQLVEEGTP